MNIITEKKMIENIEDLVKIKNQRSGEWMNYKSCRIGGSEIYNIIKLRDSNLFTFINNFLFNKIDRKNFFIAAPTFGGGSHGGDKGDLTAEGAFGNSVNTDLHLQAGLHLIDAALVNFELHFHFGKIRQVNDVLPLAQGGAFLDDAGGAAVA